MTIHKVGFLFVIAGMLAISPSAYAFDLKVPSMPGQSSNSATPNEKPDVIVKNTRNSMGSFVKSKMGLIEAMGGAEQLAAYNKMLDGLKLGDVAASKEDIETIVTLDKNTNDLIASMTTANKKIDDKNKALAGKSMTEYVKALVSLTVLSRSVQNLSKNPVALAGQAPSVLYLAKELPGVTTSGTTSTKTLLTYLSSNGVDTSEANKAAKELGM